MHHYPHLMQCKNQRLHSKPQSKAAIYEMNPIIVVVLIADMGIVASDERVIQVREYPP